jgi:hypothetical protein
MVWLANSKKSFALGNRPSDENMLLAPVGKDEQDMSWFDANVLLRIELANNKPNGQPSNPSPT